MRELRLAKFVEEQQAHRFALLKEEERIRLEVVKLLRESAQGPAPSPPSSGPSAEAVAAALAAATSAASHLQFADDLGGGVGVGEDAGKTSQANLAGVSTLSVAGRRDFESDAAHSHLVSATLRSGGSIGIGGESVWRAQDFDGGSAGSAAGGPLSPLSAQSSIAGDFPSRTATRAQGLRVAFGSGIDPIDEDAHGRRDAGPIAASVAASRSPLDTATSGLSIGSAFEFSPAPVRLGDDEPTEGGGVDNNLDPSLLDQLRLATAESNARLPTTPDMHTRQLVAVATDNDAEKSDLEPATSYVG